MLISSCKGQYDINLEKHYLEVDHTAQEIVIYADAKITEIEYDFSESDVDSQDCLFYHIGTKRYLEHEWFKIILDHSSPYHICILLDENLSGQDRKVKVYADHLAGCDTALIVQKRKPSRQ